MQRRPLVDAVTAEVEAGRLPGAVLLLEEAGAVSEFIFGVRNPTTREPMTSDTLFWAASMTKPVTAAVTLMLVEDGKLDLDDPLERHVEEFGSATVGLDSAPLRRSIRIRDLMSHTAGIIEGSLGDSALHALYYAAVGNGITDLTGPEYVRRLAALPLFNQPGAMWHYGFGFDVLGHLLERLSGMRLGDLMRTRLFEPLGMCDTSFGVPSARAGTYATSFSRDPSTGLPSPMPDLRRLRFDVGGLGLVTTAGDYMRFAHMLLRGGEADGRRLLSEAAINEMTTNSLPKSARGHPSDINPLLAGYGFGLGVAVAGNGDYTWPAFSGTNWWNSPSGETTVVWMAHTPSLLRYRYRALLQRFLGSARPGAFATS